MKFCFHLQNTLPKLAWCAHIKPGNPVIDLFHGPGVHTMTDQWFFEGAWAGDFMQGAFDLAQVCMGTGGKIVDGNACFVSPTHTLERLYVQKTEAGAFISNSLAFLLCQSGTNMDPQYIFYLFDILSYRHGLQRYTRSLPTRTNHRVRLYYHCNINISKDLQVTELPKTLPPLFPNFSAYFTFLEESVSAIGFNAQSVERTHHFTPITTISSGYDAPAAAVFAKKIGAQEAILFPKARDRPVWFFMSSPPQRLDESTGREIAKILGMRVVEYDRMAYLQKTGFPEAEFYAGGANVANVVMSPLENILSQKIFFTGFHGDGVWARTNTAVGPYLQRVGASGCGLSEFRLRLGFIHVPLPYFGAVRHESLYRLSNAEEMRPWRTNTSYDRPIPRRILEEAGVPGHLFGQHKNAIIVVTNFEGLKSRMTPGSYQDFMRYFHRQHSFRIWKDLFIVNGLHYLYNVEHFLRSLLTSLEKRIGIKLPLPRMIPDSYKFFKGIQPLCFHWGIEKIKTRYTINQPQDH